MIVLDIITTETLCILHSIIIPRESQYNYIKKNASFSLYLKNRVWQKKLFMILHLSCF
jgi:hypothetical protein